MAEPEKATAAITTKLLQFDSVISLVRPDLELSHAFDLARTANRIGARVLVVCTNRKQQEYLLEMLDRDKDVRVVHIQALANESFFRNLEDRHIVILLGINGRPSKIQKRVLNEYFGKVVGFSTVPVNLNRGEYFQCVAYDYTEELELKNRLRQIVEKLGEEKQVERNGVQFQLRKASQQVKRWPAWAREPHRRRRIP